MAKHAIAPRCCPVDARLIAKGTTTTRLKLAPSTPGAEMRSAPLVSSQHSVLEHSLDSGRSVARPCRRPCRARIWGLFQMRNLLNQSLDDCHTSSKTRLNNLDIGGQTVKVLIAKSVPQAWKPRDNDWICVAAHVQRGAVSPCSWQAVQGLVMQYGPLECHDSLMPARCALIRANIKFATLGDNGCTADHG